MSTAAKHLKPVILELGGKDAMVICEDADLDQAISFAMRGVFQNCGQNCCGVERLFVYESIFEKCLKTLLCRIQTLRQGNPLEKVDCGSMVMQKQIQLIQDLVDDAIKHGATLHCGGSPSKLQANKGQFYPPTLLSDITPNMRIAQEEVFGPIMCLMKVPKDSDEALIKLVNHSKFGLGSSVFSAKRAQVLGERFKTGMFTSNDFGVNYLIQSFPFGGVQESGFGRFAGPEGLRACCLERSIVVDRFPGIRTSIPKPIDYPIDTARGMGFGKGLIKLFYGGLLEKIKGIMDL